MVFVSFLLATPAIIFWLWLVILTARVAKLCPEKCTCELGGYRVVCYEASLNAVPLIYFTNIRELSLFADNITLLKKDSFVSLTELDELYINYCGISEIDLGAFNGLAKLTGLSLRGNSLTHLYSELFSGLVNLNYIDLSWNKLQYLHPDTFLVLPNLQMLYLNINIGIKIPTDRNFIYSHSLSYLGLSTCLIDSLSVETFANVSALKVLNLGLNLLRTLDINMLRALPRLSEMYLGGNPLQCDCQLQEVWRWCEDRNIETDNRFYKEPYCYTPSEMKGMRWGVLEKVQCLEGNTQYYGDYNSTKYSYTDVGIKDISEYDVEIIKKYQAPLYAFPFIFGTISNVILLIIIICNKDMRTVTNMYIINLAISDIINLTVLFSEGCANKIIERWLDGNILCMLLPFCRRISVGLSAYSVAVYSFQRYRVTVNPLQVRISPPPTWRVTLATICGVWIFAALFSVPSALSKYLCTEKIVSRNINYYHNVVIFELLVSCVLPLFVVAFSYVMTARRLVESSRGIYEGTQNPQMETRRNTAKIVLGLAFVFMISYVPYHVFWTYFIFSENERAEYKITDFFKAGLHFYKLEFLRKREVTDILDNSNYQFQYTYLISTYFLLINSCLNPVALFCTSSQFKQHLKRYLSCSSKTNSPSNYLELQ
jgi:hypothetical protein